MKKLFLLFSVCLGLVCALCGCGKAAAVPGEELLVNGGFERGSEGWEFSSWQDGAFADFPAADGSLAEGGDRLATLTNREQNKSVLSQKVKVVKNATYRLSGWIRVDVEVTSKRSDFSGAHLAIGEYGYMPENTLIARTGWEYFEIYFRSVDYGEVTVEVRLGSDSLDSRGKASFDNLSLTAVAKSDVPAGAAVQDVAKTAAAVDAGRAWAVVGGVAFALLLVFAFLFFAGKIRRERKLDPKLLLWLLLFAGLALRVIIAFLVPGHKYDLSCWRAWGVQLAGKGPWEFYILNGDVSQINPINDYVPGYMYVLLLLGGIKNLFGLGYDSMAYYGLVKLPAIFADIGCALLLYRIARKRFSSTGSLVAMSLFLFNPFVIVNSSAWGQIESVTTLWTLLTLYLVLQKKFYLSGLAFTGGVLFKFQTVFIFPVYAAYLVYEAVKHRELRWRLPLYLLSYLAIFYIICLPFTAKQIGAGDALFPFKLYLNQIDRYNEYSLNAFNIFTLFGLNRVGIASTAAMSAVNYLVIAVLAACCVLLFLRGGKKSGLYLTAALLVTAVCLFSVKVHERYLYPGVVLMLAAFLVTRDKRLLAVFGGFSLIHYVNTVVILLRDAGDFVNGEFLLVFFSLASILLFVYFAYVAMSLTLKKRNGPQPVAAEGKEGMTEENKTISPETGSEQTPPEEERAQKQAEAPQKAGMEEGPVRRPAEPKSVLSIVTRDLTAKERTEKRRLHRADWIVMGALTLLAGLLAFLFLGGMSAPVTYWESAPENGADYVILAKPAESEISEVWVYTGIPEENNTARFSVHVGSTRNAAANDWQLGGSFYASPTSDRDGNWSGGTMYKWSCLTMYKQERPAPFVKISTSYAGARVLEVVIIDKATGKPMENVSVDSGLRENSAYTALFDEQDTFTGKNSLWTDMYFDEIYHARTAYELIQGWDIYEWTHPPLGKEIIALGVLMFGMNPFGWRVMSALFSVALIPVAYLLAKRIFRNSWFAGIFAGFFVQDGLRMVQGRIATLDAISVFFILLSFFFMLLFTEGNFNKPGTDRGKGLFRHYLWFALSGVVFGLSVATKWTGVYAGIGLLVLFVWYVMKRAREYVAAGAHAGDGPHAALFAQVRQGFTRNLLLLIGCGVVFFLLVPFCIYLMSYIPTYRCLFSYEAGSKVSFFTHFWNNQTQMFGYHSGLKESHKSASIWITWLIDLKSVFFYNGGSAGTYARIHSIGTPLLYWGSFAGLIYFVYYLIDAKLRIRRGEMDADDKLYRSNVRILGVLFVGFLSNLLPWVFVTRATFFYHFMPSSLFYYGFLVLLLRQIYFEGNKRLFDVKLGGAAVKVTLGKLIVAISCFLIALNFALFYPVFSGVPISQGAADVLFRWYGGFGGKYGSYGM